MAYWTDGTEQLSGGVPFDGAPVTPQLRHGPTVSG